ncbi:hypothetical protein EXIGLDRAFT_702738 [Exidia glandulosa HHB12029]|uniref:Uncharacterized protein n=1 Tax=Exidia glandulosa HHB12029 TaxID=1314781 RepID=A0A165CE86_EXIGL|nr:hypothetical protein EXIGLDRAFT_702738 [Exidia glandulosa HHB12029]
MEEGGYDARFDTHTAGRELSDHLQSAEPPRISTPERCESAGSQPGLNGPRIDTHIFSHELLGNLQATGSFGGITPEQYETAKPPSIDLIALDQDLSRLYAQAHTAMLASSRLAQSINALKERLVPRLSPVDNSGPPMRRSTTTEVTSGNETSCSSPRSLMDAQFSTSSELQPVMTLGPWHEFATAQRPAISILKEMMSFRGGLLLPLPKAVASWKGHPFIDVFYTSVEDRNVVLRAFRAQLSDAYEGVKAAPAMLVLR